MQVILSICANPDILSGMLIVNSIIMIIKILIPIFIIITGIISYAKAVIGQDNDLLKKATNTLIIKFFVGAIVFFIPTLVNTVIETVDNTFEYKSCFTNATRENIKVAYINRADSYVATVETTKDLDDYNDAKLAVSKLEDGSKKNNYLRRLEIIYKYIKDRDKKEAEKRQAEWQKIQDVLDEMNTPSLQGPSGYSSSGDGVASPGVEQKSEPDPSAAINYWKNYVNPQNFIYPKDEKTGLPLGAWPKNYNSIPASIKNYKVYAGSFIFPTTPENGSYHFVYEHNGIDIMATFGTPVYSPVSGNLEYSEWGHTVNRGGDETAYSITVKLDQPTNVQGKTITAVFMTHMSGIRYRCSWGKCNRHISKGELIGFTGNAAGTSESIGWAPHLHMTYYASEYENGLTTTKVEALYEIPNYTKDYKIQAGG